MRLLVIVANQNLPHAELPLHAGQNVVGEMPITADRLMVVADLGDADGLDTAQEEQLRNHDLIFSWEVI